MYPDLAFLSPLALMEVVNSPCDAGLLYVFDKAVLHLSDPALACLCSLCIEEERPEAPSSVSFVPYDVSFKSFL